MSIGRRFWRMGRASRASRSLSCCLFVVMSGCTSDAIDSQAQMHFKEATRSPEAVCSAEIIAEVTIDELWDLRSAAFSGVVLTPEPTDVLITASPSMAGQVWRPILLSIDTLYKGELDPSLSILTAVVHDLQFHYVPEVSPRILVESQELQVGDRALVLFKSAYLMETHPVHAFLSAEAEFRTAEGAPTYVAQVRSWYRIEGSDAVNYLWPKLDVAELRARVLDCSGSGTTDASENAGPSSHADPTPYPTEQDLIADARATAEAVAEDDPELSDASIIPTLTQLLQATDPYVRRMGASADWDQKFDHGTRK